MHMRPSCSQIHFLQLCPEGFRDLHTHYLSIVDHSLAFSYVVHVVDLLGPAYQVIHDLFRVKMRFSALLHQDLHFFLRFSKQHKI